MKEPSDLNFLLFAILKNQKISPNTAKAVMNIRRYPGSVFIAKGLMSMKWKIVAMNAR